MSEIVRDCSVRRWKGSAGDRSGGALFVWCLHGHKVAIRGPRGLKAFAWAERTFGNRRAAARAEGCEAARGDSRFARD